MDRHSDKTRAFEEWALTRRPDRQRYATEIAGSGVSTPPHSSMFHVKPMKQKRREKSKSLQTKHVEAVLSTHSFSRDQTAFGNLLFCG